MRAPRLGGSSKARIKTQGECFIYSVFRTYRSHYMSKSNIPDGAMDAFAATALICIAVVTMVVWLSGMPS